MKYETECGYVDYDLSSDMIGIDEDGDEVWSCDYMLIELVYVYPQYRRQGHARALLAGALEAIKAQGHSFVKLAALPKEDSIETEDLVAFYESLGFEVSEQQGADAIFMEKRI